MTETLQHGKLTKASAQDRSVSHGLLLRPDANNRELGVDPAESLDSPATPAQVGTRRLVGLCNGLGLASQRGKVVSLFERMVSPWGHLPLRAAPTWSSHVVDDGTPFEFSVGFEKHPELRILVEPQGPAATLQSNQAAALRLLDELAGEFDIDTKRFERVSDLFIPDEPQGSFSVWLAGACRAKGGPVFKVYLNPAVHGREHAPAVVEEMLARLGFWKAWPTIAQSLIRRGPLLDELKYVSLDLSNHTASRIKVYARHQYATTADLELAAAVCTNRSNVRNFVRVLVPEIDAFLERAPLTCYSYTDPSSHVPSAATTHFPINGYAASDLDAKERICRTLDFFRLPRAHYARALDAFATRPLDSGVGLQSYVSLRSCSRAPRITVYFPVELYRPGTVADPNLDGSRSITALLEQYTRGPGALDHHPLLHRIRRGSGEGVGLAGLIVALDSAAEPVGKHIRALAEQLGDSQLACGVAGIAQKHIELAGWLRKIRKTEVRQAAVTEPLGISFQQSIPSLFPRDDVARSAGAALASAVFMQRLMSFVSEQLSKRKSTAQFASEASTPELQAMLVGLVGGDMGLVAAGAGAACSAYWRFAHEVHARCYATAQPRMPDTFGEPFASSRVLEATPSTTRENQS